MFTISWDTFAIDFNCWNTCSPIAMETIYYSHVIIANVKIQCLKIFAHEQVVAFEVAMNYSRGLAVQIRHALRGLQRHSQPQLARKRH